MPWNHPPTLCATSECRADLDFSPVSHWPQGLPAVAVSGWLLAGFQQQLAFNHLSELDARTEIAELFCSLYQELTFAEVSRLFVRTRKPAMEWFPFDLIAQHYRINPGPHFVEIAQMLSTMPQPFQNWCALRKLHQGDLLPLLAVHHLEGNATALMDLHQVLLATVTLGLTRNQGSQSLELGLELLMAGHAWQALQPDGDNAEHWLNKLKALRYPETKNRDEKAAMKILGLPWSGSSQVKWSRQGDSPGIEVKLFVSKPSDLKKFAQGFNSVMEELEKKDSNPWIAQSNELQH